MNTGRYNSIRAQLDHLKERGVIKNWYSYNPGGGKTLWVVTVGGQRTQSFGTRDLELVLWGLAAAPDLTEIKRLAHEALELGADDQYLGAQELASAVVEVTG